MSADTQTLTPVPPEAEALQETAAQELEGVTIPRPDSADGSLPYGNSCFLDREQSWLQFNLRVLDEAGNRAVPLLERLKFLSIYYSNLDEFFMVRVGSLTHRAMLMPEVTDIKTGWDNPTRVKRILRTVEKQQPRCEQIWHDLRHDLKAANIEVLDFRHLNKTDELMTKKIFETMRPLLSPRVVETGKRVPFLGNRESYVAVALGKNGTDLGFISLYRVPKYQVYEVNGRQKVVIMADLLCHYAPQLFKKKDAKESVLVRLTRNADVFIDEDINDDMRERMEKLLKKRNRQMPVRLQITGVPSLRFKQVLSDRLAVPERNTYVSSVPTDLGFGSSLSGTSGLKYGDRKPVRTVHLKKGEYFPYLEKHDLLLSFPYQSMSPFTDLLYEAADDPEVTSICITLYRLASCSKVAVALAYAADRGKDVLCLLELRARFDEQNNIDYSTVLADAGCRVVYGLPDYKVHSKLCLITKKTAAGETKYITQVGTGNYNEITNELYTDLSLITSQPDVGRDAEAVFDSLAVGQVPEATSHLMVAPNSFKSRLLELLDGEIAKGSAGRVAIKVNSLNDVDVMNRLIACSMAGVRVELFVRGICCLRPGVPGYTENITVKSVVGRHLEHSRILMFGVGEEQSIFVGSGDLLNRNTIRRVEAFIEVVTPETRIQVREIMNAFREDREKGRLMQSDGTYLPPEGVQGTASQDRLWEYFSRMNVEAAKPEPPKPEGFWAKLKHFFG